MDAWCASAVRSKFLETTILELKRRRGSIHSRGLPGETFVREAEGRIKKLGLWGRAR